MTTPCHTKTIKAYTAHVGKAVGYIDVNRPAAYKGSPAKPYQSAAADTN